MKPMRSAAVIIPTFNHGSIIRSAIVSAQQQTIDSLDIVVVGDGAPDETKDLVAEMSKSDSRIRGVWNPKGERLGELHRNDILQNCETSAICYLSDDDLWSPVHVEMMLDVLRGVDFAHSNHLFLTAEQLLHPVAVSFEYPLTHQAELNGSSFIGLSVLGHTTTAVKHHGLKWHLTPPNVYTDWHFITGAMHLGLTFGSTKQVTVLNLAGVFRREWSNEKRLVEIEEWLPRISGPQWKALVEQTLVGRLAQSGEAELASSQAVEKVKAELELANHRILEVEQLQVTQRRHLEEVQVDLDQKERALAEVHDTLARLMQSRAVRLQQLLLRSRLLTALWQHTK